jgi:hypothetical protein
MTERTAYDKEVIQRWEEAQANVAGHQFDALDREMLVEIAFAQHAEIEWLRKAFQELANRDDAAEIERLTVLVEDALRGLHNDFEPDNQSALYKRIRAALEQKP